MSNALIIEEIKKAVGAHGMWKMKLRTAIKSKSSDVTPLALSCDNLCDFGKWLYGSKLDAATRARKPYQVIKRLHAEFHKCASRVLELALLDKTEEAQALLEGEFDQRSTTLVRALTKWRSELSRPMAA